MEENSNKNAIMASTQRDLIAGEVSKDLTRRLILPEDISRAHDEGILHFHDADYFIQPIFNCCLINIGDMLDNGTVMNGKMIESPKSFQVACTVMTQIIASVASSQYGGQSVDLCHLGKYLRRSKEKFRKKLLADTEGKLDETTLNKILNQQVRDELASGAQTIQYQINTLMTTNGQSPFVTLFMHLDDSDEYVEENALISPVHWQYGAIARLKKGETIDKLLLNGYSTLSLGYIGLYELTLLMKGSSHTSPEGETFALKVMEHMRDACAHWKKESGGLGFALYGTPAESLCYRFARIDQERFGTIKDVTDKGYYTNSYHVDVREHIDAFHKFSFESQFQKISTGGCISYVEVPNMRHNPEAVEAVIHYIYDNIQYAEFNTKNDYCQKCGFDGEITINDNMEWECPQCHNKDQATMNVTRRTCGYLGENFWNVGKTKEIKSRVMHL